jgi:hypothetical protein
VGIVAVGAHQFVFADRHVIEPVQLIHNVPVAVCAQLRLLLGLHEMGAFGMVHAVTRCARDTTRFMLAARPQGMFA